MLRLVINVILNGCSFLKNWTTNKTNKRGLKFRFKTITIGGNTIKDVVSHLIYAIKRNHAKHSSFPLGVWQGVGMDSLRYHQGPLCPTNSFRPSLGKAYDSKNRKEKFNKNGINQGYGNCIPDLFNSY
jgi:hypothetical protein